MMNIFDRDVARSPEIDRARVKLAQTNPHKAKQQMIQGGFSDNEIMNLLAFYGGMYALRRVSA